MYLPEDERDRSPSKQEKVRNWSIINQVPGPHRPFARISIPQDRVDDIKQFPRSKTPKELERFLGIVAFSHRIVPHASGKMASPSRLKNISRQKEFDDAWLPVHDEAFADVKAAIATANIHVHPQPDAPTDICCDASNIAAGAVLFQIQHGLWKPLSFWNNQLNNAQRNYSATYRELLSVSYAVYKFRSYIEGQPIVVLTDHTPRVGSVTRHSITSDLAAPFTEDRSVCGPNVLPEGRTEWRRRYIV